MKIPVLTYEPMRIDGNGYGENDLVALASDLRQVTDAGFAIRPLREIVDAWLDGRASELGPRTVALACDHGADFDYVDLPHPRWGLQRSVFNLLRDFAAERPGAQPRLNVTCFAIVGPQARAALDGTCMLGKGWWRDDWWPTAVESGLIHIANQSWDHNHETLPPDLATGVRAGTFRSIDNERLAEHEIGQASAYLQTKAPNPGVGLFAYPYGDTNEFLLRDYFPRRSRSLGIRAAFTTRAGFLENGCGRWEAPRFMFRRDWSSPEELATILRAAADPERDWVPATRREWNAAAAPQRPETPDAFRKFLVSQVDPIPGWLHMEAALLTEHLARVQRSLGIAGPTLEIGVFKGKYLAVLYALSENDERVIGVDLFVGSEDTAKDVRAVHDNVARACGDSRRLDVVVADSLKLDAAALARHTGGPARFISIDGGHTREIVFKDLESATPLLARGGIMALDDVYNFTTPGVAEGVANFFLSRKPALAPFAACYNKLFVTHPDFHARYLAEAVRFAEESTWLATHEPTLARRRENLAGGFTPTLFGHEVLPFL